ncbi:hypothetical protein [Amycolatopsis sp. NBC_01286]|uniref:hypothetical protein n=1 Tax=Amycolatopsis sp. NBC_01286 TaxID=2903560 RepID=UPI002E116E65|nr:hypothetical protein OG570_36790 [Amycolatopsis sp. NBC_01286]
MRFAGDPDQLPPVGAALLRYGGQLAQHRTAVELACAEVSRAAEAAVSRLEGRLRTARAKLEAVDPEDAAAVAAAIREVEIATANRDAGREQKRRIERTVADLRSSTGPRLLSAIRTTEQGRVRVLALWRLVERAVSAFETAVSRCLGRSTAPMTGLAAPSYVSGSAMNVGTSASPAARSPLPQPIGPGPQALVLLDLIDDSDSPVFGAADFLKVEMRVMRAGLMRLETEVLPAVRAGARLEDMRELDTRSGLTGSPASHVTVYESFFGDTSVKLSRGRDGRYTVRNGYHRIWLARQAGIDSLPADVLDVP